MSAAAQQAPRWHGRPGVPCPDLATVDWLHQLQTLLHMESWGAHTLGHPKHDVFESSLLLGMAKAPALDSIVIFRRVDKLHLLPISPLLDF